MKLTLTAIFFLLLASVLGGLLLFFYPYLPLDLLLKTDDELLQHIGVSLILFVQLNFLFTGDILHGCF